MAVYKVRAPDGKIIQLQGPEGASQEEIIRQAQRLYFPSAQPEAPREAGFLDALGGSARSWASQSRTGLAALLGDPEEAAAEGAAREAQIAQDTGEMPSFDRLRNVYNERGLISAAGQAISDIPELAAQAAPSVGAAALGGSLGGALGSAILPGPGTVVGGALGAAAGNYLAQLGGNVQAQAQEQQARGEEVDIDVGRAAGTAIAQSALEAGGAAVALGRNTVGRIIGNAASKSQADEALVREAQRTLAGTVTRGAARGGVGEMPTEVAQQVLQRWQAGQDLTSDDAFADYGEAAYAGFGGGVGVGGATGPLNRSSARARLEEMGRDPRTGEERTTPQIDAERERILREEQGDVEIGRQQREAQRQSIQEQEQAEADAQEADRQARLQSYTQPVDESLGDAALQAELVQLTAERQAGERAPQLRGRIDRIQRVLDERRIVRNLPNVEPARRAQVNEAELRANPPATRARDAAIPLIRGQYADTDTAVLRLEHQRMREQYNQLPDDQRLVYRALNEELRERDARMRQEATEARTRQRELDEELRRIREENREAREALPENLRADVVGRSNLPPVITAEAIREAGLPANAGYTRRLEGLDLNVPEQRAQAAAVLREVRANQRVSQATKDRLDALINQPQFQGIDLEAPVVQIEDAQLRQRPERLTPETAPVGPLNPEVFDALGIGKTALIRRSPEIAAMDPSVPEQRAQLLEVLDAYASESGRSERIVNNVRTYMDRLRAMDEGDGNARPDTGTDLSVTGTEPASDRAGVGVAGRSSPSTGRGTPAAAAGVTTPTAAGLDNTGGPAQQPTGPRDARDASLENMPPQAAIANANIMAGGNPPQSPRAGTEQFAREQTARRGDYDPDVVFVNSDAYATNQGAGDLAGSVTPELTAALDAGNLTEALTVIRDGGMQGYNPMEALVAKRILDSSQPLPRFELVDSLPARPDGSVPHGQYNAVTDTVTLVRGQADSHTLLHETIHAFTHRFLMEQQARGYTNPNAKALLDLYAHVRRMLPNAQEVYGMTNISEFAAEAMSNPDFQFQLMGIPYRRQSAWSWFTRALRNLFGMGEGNPVDNALFAAMVHVDGLMNPGRQAQRDGTGQRVPNPIVDVVRTMTTPPGALTPDDFRAIEASPDQEQRTAMKEFAAHFRRSVNEPSVGTKLRVRAVDNMAAVQERLADRFDQGIRNAMGDLNPLNLMRQAVDYKRIALQVYQRGGLTKDPETGYWTATDLTDADGNPLSPAEAIRQIKALGERMGTNYQETKARVSRVLEGARLHSMREFNAEKERLARAYEAQNTKEGDKRADDARASKKKLHMTNAEIDELMAVYNASPEIQRIQATLRATRENLVDAMVASGRLSPEQGRFWKDNIHYVPFNRVEEVMKTSSDTKFRGRTGISQLGQLPVLQGSYERPVANTINNYMETLSWMVGQAVRNDASLRTLRAMKDAGFAREYDEAGQAENSGLVAPAVYENGVPRYFELQSEMDLLAFTQADDTPSGLVKGFAQMARILRATVTVMPTFGLSQVVQDSMVAGIQSGTRNSAATMLSTLRKFPMTTIRQWAGRESQSSQEMHGFGVVGNYDFNPVNPLETLEHETGAMRYGAVQGMIHRLEQIAKASDQAAREAIYERTMLETGDKALAITRAREFINFNRRGASRSMRTFARVVPFFNAYTQGMDLLYRGFTGRDAQSGFGPRQARNYVLGRMAIMSALGLSYALMMQDDEDYENADEYVRRRGWILPHAFSSLFDGADGRHTPLVIPARRDWAFIFKSIPEMAVQAMREDMNGEERATYDRVMDIVQGAAETYIMEPMPAAIRPMLENLTNYSFFTGRALEGPYQQEAPAGLRVNAQTSELAREMGRQFNMSPIKIDNFIRGTFGSVGTMALQIIDPMLNGNMPERPANRIIGLSTFTAPEGGTRLTSEFYDLREKFDRANAGVNALKDDPTALREFVAKHGTYLMLKEWVNEKNKNLTDIRKMREVFMRSPDLNLTPAERRARLRQLEKIQQEILSDVPRVRGMVERRREAMQ